MTTEKEIQPGLDTATAMKEDRPGYTAGPWNADVCIYSGEEVDASGNHYWNIRPEDQKYDNTYLNITGWMAEGNARLIAAAPDLLEAADLVLDRWSSGDLAEAVRMLAAAVDKAKGVE